MDGDGDVGVSKPAPSGLPPVWWWSGFVWSRGMGIGHVGVACIERSHVGVPWGWSWAMGLSEGRQVGR